MNITQEIEQIVQECINDHKFFYLTNFALDKEEANPTIWVSILPAACILYPHFKIEEGRRENLLDVMEQAKRADPKVDITQAQQLLLADAEVPTTASDGSIEWTSYTFLISLAGFAIDELNDMALHARLIARAVELADSPWGKHEAINSLLESSKISRAQMETLVALSKKHLKGAQLKTLEKIVERRRRANEFTN